MNYLDFIILGLLLIGFILGFKDGLIRKIIGVLGIIIGLYLAVKLSDTTGEWMSPVFDNDNYFSGLISSIIIFLLCLVIAAVIKRLIHPHDKVNRLANQLLGGMAGTLQIAFFLSCFLMLFGIFNFPNKKTAGDSVLYSSVYNIVPKTIDIFLGDNKILKNYIESKDANSEKISEMGSKAGLGGKDEEISAKKINTEKARAVKKQSPKGKNKKELQQKRTHHN